MHCQRFIGIGFGLAAAFHALPASPQTAEPTPSFASAAPSATPLPDGTGQSAIPELVARALPSTALVSGYYAEDGGSSQGSGFFIARDRLLTNAHVVADLRQLKVKTMRREYTEVTILRMDRQLDLALVRVADGNEPPLEFERPPRVRPGERVLALGNPLGLERTVSDGLVSAIRDDFGDHKAQMLQISAPVSPGSSGGPLLNEAGHVVGVITASYSGGQNLNFAIGPLAVREFLNRRDPQPPEGVAAALDNPNIRFVVILLALVALFLGVRRYFDDAPPRENIIRFPRRRDPRG